MPRSTQDNDPIDTTEALVPVGWDFSNLFPNTSVASVSATSCTVSADSPVDDPDAATCLKGSPTIIASVAPPRGSGRASLAVMQTFTPNNVPGCIYVLRCDAVDTAGSKQSVWTHQPIVAPA